mmetsp:Transcript_124999/g.195870  ORF Transcript_124999/g.195870 Transcript_124999/m.195870 type:complete len:82 (-) Transcript_124999:904-1149(-)
MSARRLRARSSYVHTKNSAQKMAHDEYTDCIISLTSYHMQPESCNLRHLCIESSGQDTPEFVSRNIMDVYMTRLIVHSPKV